MSTTSKRFDQVVLALGIALLPQCGDSANVSDDDEGQCIPGELECACNGGQCLAGLSCVDAICVLTGESETGVEVGSDSSTSEEETSQDVSTGTESDTGMESDTEGNPCTEPETLCNGECINLSSDDNNCGECGNTCKVAPNTGGCFEGACTAVWSECIDAANPVPCSDVCQSEGLAGCMTAACGRFQASLEWYTFASECEAGNFSSEVQSDACEAQPSSINDSYYRCCCEQ